MSLSNMLHTLSKIPNTTTHNVLNRNSFVNFTPNTTSIIPQLIRSLQFPSGLSQSPLNNIEFSGQHSFQSSDAPSPPIESVYWSPGLDTSTNVPSPAVVPVIPSLHPMVTRSKNEIFKPKAYLSSCYLAETDPTSAKVALKDPKWVTAMQEEFNALHANNTWSLIPFSI
ncbi:hypothetical protein EZV62_002355 [Acer yangbiense]|uniref:Mitochondrial protein n=1 Tax=Acer yangbiense TaxID=1000413 RepID=A0A5C7IZ93_9ROSI|nr:hypothetical protein EZV62_002355 [Acer yangbiense]